MDRKIPILLILLLLILPVCASAEVTRLTTQWKLPSPYKPIVDVGEEWSYAGIRDYGIEALSYGSASADFTPDHEYVLLMADMYVQPGSYTTFSLETYNGQTYTGEIWLNSTVVPLIYDLSVEFNGTTINKPGMLLLPPSETDVRILAVWNYETNTSGIAIAHGTLFVDDLGYVEYDIVKDPWGQFVSVSTSAATEYYLVGFPIGDYYDYGISTSAFVDEENIIWQIYGTFSTIAGFLWQAYLWISFLILNLPMILAIGEVATMFYALTTSSSIFTAIKKWWRFNENTLKFFISFFETMLNIVRQIVSSIPILSYLWK